MNEAPRYVTFRDYLRVVRERRLLIGVIAVVFAGAGLAWSLQQETVYETSARLQFKDENVETSILGTVTPQVQTPEQRAAIAASRIATPAVARRARERLDTEISAGVLQAAVTGQEEPRTSLVRVTAQWSDAAFTARLADAFARAARDLAVRDARARFRAAARAERRVLRSLGNSPSSAVNRALARSNVAKLDQLARLVSPVEIASPAQVPSVPIAPKPVRNTLLALLLGLTVGVLVAFLRDALDRRFKTSHELSEELHLPLLGIVNEDVLGRTVVAVNGRPPLTAAETEGFRILRTNIEFLDVDHPPTLILVTSALPEEGKSTVAAALASTCALAGQRTLLVECDLRRPTIAARLGLNLMPGLTDYALGRAAPHEILQTVQLPFPSSINGDDPTSTAAPLACIVAGTPAPQPAELLRSERVKEFFAQVTEAYDRVIVDTSPLLSVVDTLELLSAADGIILCVRASRTTREQARAAKAAMAHFPVPTGIIVTGTRARDEADYGYYSYSYAYGSERQR